MKNFKFKSILIFIASTLTFVSCTEETEIPTAYETVAGGWEICQTYKYNETKNANLSDNVSDNNIYIFDKDGALYIISDSTASISRYNISNNNISYNLGDGYESSLYRINGNKIYIYQKLIENGQSVEIGFILKRTKEINGMPTDAFMSLLSSGDINLTEIISNNNTGSNESNTSSLIGTWSKTEDSITISTIFYSGTQAIVGFIPATYTYNNNTITFQPIAAEEGSDITIDTTPVVWNVISLTNKQLIISYKEEETEYDTTLYKWVGTGVYTTITDTLTKE